MNPQQEYWSGKLGDNYVNRNKDYHNYEYDNGMDKRSTFKSFFDLIPRDSTILEIGCNSGLNIGMLKEMGFSNITGIDVNQKAIDKASAKYPDVIFRCVTIEDYTPDEPFDLVFTAGVLIHIHPTNVPNVMDKMKSMSKKYIFGYEYFSEDSEPIGNYKYCWSDDWRKYFDIKPNRVEIVRTKEKNEAHIFYLY